MKNPFTPLFQLLTFILLQAGFIYPSPSFSQDIVKAKGESRVRVEQFMSREAAREQAEELAMINAIENEFDTYIEQFGDTRIADGRVNFDIIGSTQVKGEWVNTIDIKFTEETKSIRGEYGKELEIWIHCEISGEIRECVARANLEFFSMNCPDKACRTTSFFNGGNLFLHFTSPVDGYLSIFLSDNDNVYRLLPYSGMGMMSTVKIKGDEDYILFSKEDPNPFDKGFKIDALELTAEGDIEYNSIYIVFSETPYKKPILETTEQLSDGYYLPRSLPLREFKEWMGDCRADMPDFQAQRIKLSIER